MRDLTLEIKPLEGFGEILFGFTTERVTTLLGEAEDVDNIEDDDVFNTVILNYWEKGIAVFFEGMEKSVVSCFETDNPEATLYGRKVFDMSEGEVIELMAGKGFKIAETEIDKETGEKRISYDDAMIDFFYEDGALIAVNWGVLVNEKGEIEEMPSA